MMYTALINYR